MSLRQFASAYPGISIDLVEHEPAVLSLARAWFDFEDIPGVTVHIADGSAFIANAAPSSWDIIVIDAYDAASCTSDFSRIEFFSALQRALRPGGAVACNVIGTLNGRGPVSEFVSAARSVFQAVRILPVFELDEDYAPNALRNVVLVATNR